MPEGPLPENKWEVRWWLVIHSEKNAVWLLPILPHSWTQIRKKKKKKIWITQFNFQQKHCKKQKPVNERGTLKSVCCMIQGVWIQHIQEANDSAKPCTTVAQSGYPTFSSLSNPTEPFFFKHNSLCWCEDALWFFFCESLIWIHHWFMDSKALLFH